MALLSAFKAAYRAATDSRYRFHYLQRREEDFDKREAWARRLIRRIPSAASVDREAGAILNRDGILHLPELLGPTERADMKEYFETNLCADPYRPHLGKFHAPDAAPRETRVAFFDNRTVVEAPHAIKAANNPAVLAAAAAALGAKPTISYMTAWWSLPSHGEAEHAELYHRDYDDLRFLKLFLYLTDVDVESGPHAFVRGSHRVQCLSGRRRFSDEEVRAIFPAEDMLTLSGREGTAFLENTFGLHRGIPPISRARLIFQVLYSLEPYIGGPPRPLRQVAELHEGVEVDPYSNRIYLRVS